MSIISSVRVLARGATLAALATAAVAVAQPLDSVTVNGDQDTITRTTVVSVDGIDPSSASGQRELNRRIKVAVNNVCETWDVSPARERSTFEECYRNTLEATHARINERLARRTVQGTLSAS